MHLFCIPSDDREDEGCAENLQQEVGSSRLLMRRTRAQSPASASPHCSDASSTASPLVGPSNGTKNGLTSSALVSPALLGPCTLRRIESPEEREAGAIIMGSGVLPSQSELLSVPARHLVEPSGSSRQQLRQLVGDMGLALFAPLDIDGLATNSDFLASVEVRDDDYHLRPPDCRVPQHHDSHDRLRSPKSRVAVGSLKAPKRMLNSSEGSLTVATAAETIVTRDPGDDSPQTDDEDDEEYYGCWVAPEPPHSCPRVLTPDMLHQLASHFPLACQGHMLERCFCIGWHGDSILSMLHQCRMFRYTVLVIQTTRGEVLGGFATANWNDKRHNVYYGNGQSFLFASHPENSPESVLVDGQASTSDVGSLAVYPWSGENDYCQICDPDQNRIAMGGEGEFGLIVRDNFGFGETGTSRTYRNPPLVAGRHFEISAFEVYGIVPFSLSTPRLPFEAP